MPALNIKLDPKLFDLFQHCKLRCNAACCGWEAFDFSDRWLLRWCDYREASTISAARSNVVRIRDLISGYDVDSKIDIDGSFTSSAGIMIEHLDLIDNILSAHVSL